MSIENQDSTWDSFGNSTDIRGVVPILFDKSSNNFRPANADDYSTTAKTGVSNYAPATGVGTVFTLNENEIGYIRNLGTGQLYYKLGSECSVVSFSDVLKGGTAQDDGLGGSISVTNYVGDVSVSGDSSRYISWKQF